MSDNVVEIKPELNIPARLRDIADQIERGEFGEIDCACVVAACGVLTPEVIVVGEADDDLCVMKSFYLLETGIEQVHQVLTNIRNKFKD